MFFYTVGVAFCIHLSYNIIIMEISKADILAYIENNFLTKQQQQIIYDFKTSGKSVKEFASSYENYPNVDKYINTNKNLKLAALLVRMPVNQKAETPIDHGELPTLEWTLSELMSLYKSSKDSGDEDKMAKLLKQITDYQSKFGEMINENALRYGQMSTQELMDSVKPLMEDIQKYINKKKWHEGKAA